MGHEVLGVGDGLGEVRQQVDQGAHTAGHQEDQGDQHLYAVIDYTPLHTHMHDAHQGTYIRW